MDNKTDFYTFRGYHLRNTLRREPNPVWKTI